MILDTWFCFRRWNFLCLDKSWPPAMWVTSCCFRLFLEIPVLKINAGKKSRKDSKSRQQTSRSEAPGYNAWDVLRTCRSGHPVPKLEHRALELLWVCSLIQVWCVLPVLYMFMFNTLVYIAHWIYHCQMWVMLFMNQKKPERQEGRASERNLSDLLKGQVWIQFCLCASGHGPRVLPRSQPAT